MLTLSLPSTVYINASAQPSRLPAAITYTRRLTVSVLHACGLTPVTSVLRSRDHAPAQLCPKPPGGLVLVDLTLRDLMTCECPKGLWQGPMCDFSEAWSP